MVGDNLPVCLNCGYTPEPSGNERFQCNGLKRNEHGRMVSCPVHKRSYTRQEWKLRHDPPADDFYYWPLVDLGLHCGDDTIFKFRHAIEREKYLNLEVRAAAAYGVSQSEILSNAKDDLFDCRKRNEEMTTQLALARILINRARDVVKIYRKTSIAAPIYGHALAKLDKAFSKYTDKDGEINTQVPPQLRGVVK